MCLLFSSYTCGSGRCRPNGGRGNAFWSSPHLLSCSARHSCSSRARSSPAWSARAPGPRAAAFYPASSFVVSQTNLLWTPGIPVGLVVLAFAQIGVHLVFFLHLGSGSDHTNNILALAFGLLIVFLVIAGSCWIIADLNANMMSMSGNTSH